MFYFIRIVFVLYLRCTVFAFKNAAIKNIVPIFSVCRRRTVRTRKIFASLPAGRQAQRQKI